MSKNKLNKNNEFKNEDSDIEQDMKTLGQVRDDLLKVFKETTTLSDKLSIANTLNAIVQSRENAEMFLLRVMGAFDNEECDGCPECDPSLRQTDKGDAN